MVLLYVDSDIRVLCDCCDDFVAFVVVVTCGLPVLLNPTNVRIQIVLLTKIVLLTLDIIIIQYYQGVVVAVQNDQYVTN